MRLGLIVLAVSLMPAQATAQAAAPAESLAAERRLSPEQIEAVLVEASRKRQAEERRIGPQAGELAPKPQLHGELGVSVGTGGYREAFGTIIHPLGDDGVAAISLDFVDWGKRRYPR